MIIRNDARKLYLGFTGRKTEDRNQVLS